MTIFIIGFVLVASLVSGLWMRTSYNKMEKLGAENMMLIEERGALAEEINQLNSELNGRDNETKKLRNKIQVLGIEAENLAKKQQQLLDLRVDQFVVEQNKLAYRFKEIEAERQELREAWGKAEQTIESQQKSINSMKIEIAAGQIKIAELAEIDETHQETSIKKEQTISELAKNNNYCWRN